MQNNGKLSMRNMLMLIALLPLTVAMVIVTIINVSNFDEELARETKQSLRVASNGLAEYCEEKYGLTGELKDDIDYVNSYAKYDIDLTIFTGDTRTATSLDQSLLGTTADEKITEKVLGGEEYFGKGVKIAGKKYYVVYTPIKDTKTGDVVGMAFAGKQSKNVEKAISESLLSSVILAVVLVGIFGTIVVIVALRVVKPMKRVGENITLVGEGDLGDKDVIDSTIRETKQLVMAANRLQAELTSVLTTTVLAAQDLSEGIEQVTQIVDSSTEDVTQISSVMEDLAQGATQMAQSVQDLSNQVTDMGDAINDIADNVNNLAKNSENIKKANDEASNYISLVSKSSERSVTAVQSISEQIDSTNKAINSIEEAIAVITSVADQTNLLALNASIEAARAGEAGRGFAVVATEIQSLSEQSNSGANRIKEIVGEIMRQSDESVKLSDEVQSIITEEQKYISDTQQKFKVLNSEIDEVVGAIGNIADKTDGLEVVKDAIISNISDLSAISEENAASNEEVSASVEHIVSAFSTINDNMHNMDEKSKGLMEAVGYFHG